LNGNTTSLAQSRRVIFNADDFGSSASINEAVMRAHREGVLTSASLMVNGAAFDEAVTLAKQTPTLGVGLHLTLVCGKPVLDSKQIPGLVNSKGRFSDNPVRTGVKYFFSSSLRAQLEKEIGAQIEKFRATGLQLDHLNGHLHFHLHPEVLDILVRRKRDWNIPAVRLTHDPLRLNLGLASGHLLYRMTQAFVFKMLSRRARGSLQQVGIRHTDYVFGLLQNGRVNEEYLLKLLPLLPSGDIEIYSHPCTQHFPHELAALTSTRVKDVLKNLPIRLCRYQDLTSSLPPRK
jgi:hopanoid biosynthesis associated protein HpnK